MKDSALFGISAALRQCVWLLCFLLLSTSAQALTFIESHRQGIALVTGIAQPTATAVSADGKHVYVSAYGSDSVAIFARDPSSGSLAFVSSIVNNVGGVSGIDGANSLVLSPDDKHLYVAGLLSSSLAVFSRNATSGALTFVQALVDNAGGGPNLGGASSVAISPDGTKLYVTALFDNAVSVYTRNTTNGTLSSPVGQIDGQGGVDGLKGATGVAVSPDGNHVYVTGQGESKLAAFDKNLNFIATYANGGAVSGLSGAYGVALSPDGAHVYVASNGDNAIAMFSRAASGALTFVKAYRNGVDGVNGLSGVRSVALSPDGAKLYAAGTNDNKVAEFDRAGDGSLTYFTAATSGLNGVSNLNGPTWVAVDGNNDHLYVSAISSSAVVVFSTVATDLALTMSVAGTINDQAEINSDITYNMQITNQGEGSATDTVLTHTLPAGVTVVSTTPSQGGPCTLSGVVLTCPLGTIAVGATVNVDVVVTTPGTEVVLDSSAVVDSTRPDSDNTNNSAAVSTTVLTKIFKADLTLTLTDNVDAIHLGGALTYQMQLTNQGPDTANNVVLTHTVPANVIVGAVSPPDCAYNTGTVTCAFAALDAAATVNISVGATAPTTLTTLQTSATVSADEADLNPADNEASDSTIVEEQSTNLVISSLSGPATANAGTQLTYTLAFANPGTQASSNVTLSNVFTPDGSAQYVSSSTTFAGALDPGNPCADAGGGTVDCNVGTMQPGDSGTLQLVMQALLNGNLTNTATISGDIPENAPADNTKAAVTTVSGNVADLALAINADPNPVFSGGTVKYTVLLTNNGPDTASAITLSNSIVGNGLAIGTPTMNGGTCTGGAVFTCTIPEMPAGGSATLSVDVIPNQTGTISYTASAVQGGAGFDPGTPNTVNHVTAVSAVSADVSITMTADAPSATQGTTLSYTAVITNSSTEQAQGLVLTDVLPPEVDFLTATASQGSCAQAAGTVSCNFGNLDGGAEATAIIQVVPTITGSLNNTATISTTTFDPVVSNNSATVALVVGVATADLQVTIVETTDPVPLGGEVVHTVNIVNNGPDNATNVVMESVLPGGVGLVQAIAGQGEGCVENTQVVTCNLGNLNSGLSTTVTMIFQSSTVGVVQNTVTVTADQHDPAVPNTASAETQITELQTIFFIEAHKDGISGIDGLGGATALAMSPDGKNVYAAGFRDHGVAVFARDTNTGSLTFLQGLIDGVDGVTGLNRVTDIAVSENGSAVYATGFSSSALIVFSRDTNTGRLLQTQVLTDGAGGVSGLVAPFGITVKGGFVYTAALGSGAVSVFTPSGNGLSFVETQQGLPGMKGLTAVAVSPDGSRLYAASFEDNALVVFNRDSASGRLSYVQTMTDGVGGVTGLAGAYGLTVSDDGRFVYVAGNTTNSIAVFRAGSGGVSFVSSIASEPGLNGVSALEISRDGLFLYSAGTNDNTLGIFKRSPDTGELRFGTALTDGIANVDGLSGVRDVMISNSGGDHIYAVGLNDNAIAVFRTAAAEVSPSIEANKQLAVVGEDLLYTITINNAGPDTATNVVMLSTLPDNADFVSATASQGTPCTSDLNAGLVRCALGSLADGADATVYITVKPSLEGSLIHTVSVTGAEYDPVLPNTVTITTEAVGVADVQLTARDESDPVAVNGTLVYTMQVKNAGPYNATNVEFTNSLPSTLLFGSVETSQGQCLQELGVITCRLGDLPPLAQVDIKITGTVTQVGALTSTSTVSAFQNDPDPSNNTATEGTNVVTNIINGPYDNTGQVLSNYAIGPSGTVTGGSLQGTIVNQGTLVDVTILPGTVVSGGGCLAGNIINQGVIENACFKANTSVSGGVLKGLLIGTVGSPATLSSRIAAGADLTHVLIDSLSIFDGSVRIRAGVIFAANHNIPPGVDLTEAMPFIQEPVTGALAVNLSYDIVVNNTLMLDAANALPALQSIGIHLTQRPTGHVGTRSGDIVYVGIPLRIMQAPLGTPPGSVVINTDESVLMTTLDGRQILFQPALDNPDAFRFALSVLGLSQIQAQSDGVLRVQASSTIHYSARPSLGAWPAPGAVPNTFSFVPARAPGFNTVVLHYQGQDGVIRYQKLYSAPADGEALIRALSVLPTATDIRLDPDGWFSLRVDGFLHQGVFDYKVVRGTPAGGNVTQFIRIPDANNDGIEDFMVVFPSGDRQVMYYLPPSDVINEIPTIPAVRDGAYQFTRTGEESFLLSQGNTWYYLMLESVDRAPAGSTTGMTFNTNGTITFITPSMHRIVAYPLAVDITGLLEALKKIGFQYIEPTGKGNLLFVGDPKLWAMRPGVSATLSTQTPGLYVESGVVSGVQKLRYVFVDWQGNIRQQMFHPAPAAPATYDFLVDAMGGAVTFFNDGRVTTSTNGFSIRGAFSHSLNPGSAAAGNLQFRETTDLNRDGRGDFLLIYENGREQAIYRLP